MRIAGQFQDGRKYVCLSARSRLKSLEGGLIVAKQLLSGLIVIPEGSYSAGQTLVHLCELIRPAGRRAPPATCHVRTKFPRRATGG